MLADIAKRNLSPRISLSRQTPGDTLAIESMKAQEPGLRIGAATLLLTLSLTSSYAQTPSSVRLEEGAGSEVWHTTQRHFHSQVWESSVAFLDFLTGRTNVQRHQFTELGSGIKE